ncbi:hypothetical protein BDZ89DRAFT_1078122 [Hymenopellis radicata]|nr:hypothetical protein BDZ89DRAFT_1078122 [Hymenopellis radicata]
MRRLLKGCLLVGAMIAAEPVSLNLQTPTWPLLSSLPSGHGGTSRYRSLSLSYSTSESAIISWITRSFVKTIVRTTYCRALISVAKVAQSGMLPVVVARVLDAGQEE